MKKTTLTPFIMLDEDNSSEPLYIQVYEKIRDEILAGELESGTKLPSTRGLAAQLNVSRITITTAYEHLYAEGYLEGKTGSGSYVASELPDKFLQTAGPELPGGNRASSKGRNKPELSKYGEMLNGVSAQLTASYSNTATLPFQNGLPDIDEFPIDTWAKISQKVFKNLSPQLLNYGSTKGYRGLRAAVADHLKSARGVKCSPEQVIMTGGTQQGIDLVGRVLADSGDTVWMENPCYLGARSTFSAFGAKLLHLSVDDQGVSFRKARNNKEKPKLIYITPSHQFPLGVTMSLQRRLNLLEFAEENSSWIIEDDYNSEYRFSGRPISSLQGLDRSGRVIYLGTFSKTIFPALRLGCMVVPEELIEVFKRAKALVDRHSPIIDQLVLAEFISGGNYVRHIRRMRKLYGERRNIMINAVRDNLGDRVRIQSSSAGLHLTLWLNEKLDDIEVSQKLAKKGIVSEPLATYTFGSDLPPALILGYAAFARDEINAGIGELAKILAGG